MLIFQGVGGGLIFVYPLVGETYNPITYLLSGGISFVFLFGWESLLNMTQHFKQLGDDVYNIHKGTYILHPVFTLTLFFACNQQASRISTEGLDPSYLLSFTANSPLRNS